MLLVSVVWLGLTGFWRMFAHFPYYDDEGYILLTVRAYLEHGGLYSNIYTQYGPGFYVLLEGVQRLSGAVMDHEFARWFTLTLWLGGAAGTGLLVSRLVRERAMAWFSGVAVFIFLHQLSEEAFHPGAVVVFLLPAVLWAMVELLERGRLNWAVAVGSAGAAGLGLLKINVGVLFAVGCGGWFILTTHHRWRRRGIPVGEVAAGVLFAAALMHGLLHAAWVQTFLLLYAAGLTGIAVVIRSQRSTGFRPVAAFTLGAAGVSGLVVAAVMYRGTTAAALLEGMLLGPMRHAEAYSYAVDWRPGTLLMALAALVALAGYRWLLQQGRVAAAEHLVIGLRLLLLVGLLAVLALLEHFRVIGVLFSYAIPWLWVWLVELSGVPRRPTESDGRALVVCALLLQTLHAYPVGGIQICWGSFLLFAVVAMAVPETGAWLEARCGARFRPGLILSGLLVLVAGAKVGMMAQEYRQIYWSNTALALPGTGGLRLSERETAAYRSVVANSVLQADVLFSLPGMFSFNLWSGRPTPTQRNTTLWYSLLSETEQHAIIQAMERARRPGLVVDQALLAILRGSGAEPRGPLFVYLLSNYQPAFSIHGLGFWVKKGRAIAPVETAWQTSGSGDTHSFRACLVGTGESVESLEVFDPDQPATERLVLNARNAQVSIQSINPDGSPRAAAQETGWPFQFDGLGWITVRSDALRPLAPERSWLLGLKGRDQREVGSVPFVDPN